jgi:mannobiose 2-epimerase
MASSGFGCSSSASGGGGNHARLTSISDRLTKLANSTINFWLTHGPDGQNGFFATLDRTGASTSPTDKGLIQESRDLWAMTTWYERRGKSADAKTAADNLYNFIVGHYRDGGDGEFFYKVSADGSRVVDAKKQFYSEGFAIFALSTYGRVFANSAAIADAMACFKSIDARGHDPVNGGYDETNDAGWVTDGGKKDMNAHIHLMEAFASLYQATGDASVKARLDEFVDLVATKLLQPGGYQQLEFNLDWTPFGTPLVSYGHDLETSWLMLDCARVSGRDGDATIRAAALAMGTNSSSSGFDSVHGGYYSEGKPGGAVTVKDKVWWVEFEALSGLWWMYQLSGDTVHLDRLEATLTWLEKANDATYGEWYWTTNDDGTPGSHGTNKGEEWKAAYHVLRSLMFNVDWLAAATK